MPENQTPVHNKTPQPPAPITEHRAVAQLLGALLLTVTAFTLIFGGMAIHVWGLDARNLIAFGVIAAFGAVWLLHKTPLHFKQTWLQRFSKDTVTN